MRLAAGHCGATTEGDAGDCARGSLGSLGDRIDWSSINSPGRPREERRSALASACLRLCNGCTRCAHVSFSLRYLDCSWYAQCDRLSEEPADFFTISSNAATPLAPPSAALQAVLDERRVCFESRAPMRQMALEVERQRVMMERALARRSVELRPERILWLSTINVNNFAESTLMLISGLTQTHLQPNATWRPLYGGQNYEYNPRMPKARAPRELLVQLLLPNLWRNGRPVAAADSFHDDDKAAQHRRTATTIRCYAGAAMTETFSPLNAQYAYPPARAAYRSFFTAVRRHLGLPPLLGAAAAAAAAATAPRAPRAIFLQRRPVGGIAAGREVLNEADVLATLRAAHFEIDGAIEPGALPLKEVARRFGDAKLLLTMHGASLANAALMPPGDGAMLEVFPAGMAYGSGFELAMAARLRHLPLFLDWSSGDRAFMKSEAAFRKDAFSDWRCTPNEDACGADGLWTAESLGRWLRSCEDDEAALKPENPFHTGICNSIAKNFDVRLPLAPLAALAAAAARHLASPPRLRPALHGRVAAQSQASRCPRALILTKPLWHIERPKARGEGVTTHGPIEPAGSVLTALLRQAGMCAHKAVAPLWSGAASSRELERVSLVISHESAAAAAARPARRLTLPRTAVWIRVLPADANATALLAAPRFEHRGPQLLAFCGGAGGGATPGGACVVHERVMRTWLRVAQATLLPERAAAESFMGGLRSGYGRCSCASQTRP